MTIKTYRTITLPISFNPSFQFSIRFLISSGLRIWNIDKSLGFNLSINSSWLTHKGKGLNLVLYKNIIG